jgi:hypothetical protein
MKTTEENLQILKDMNAMRKTQKRSEMIEAMEMELGVNQPSDWTPDHDSCNASFQRICQMIVESTRKVARQELECLTDILYDEMHSELSRCRKSKVGNDNQLGASFNYAR